MVRTGSRVQLPSTAPVKINDDSMYRRQETIDELKRVFNKNKDNQLAIVVIGHLIIETLIEDLIRTQLQKPNKFFELKDTITYAIKVHLLFAMGIIKDKQVRRSILELNTIRNNFAHKKGYILTKDEVNKILFDPEDKNIEALSGIDFINSKLIIAISSLAGYLCHALEDYNLEDIELFDKNFK